jgi:hypothetical protein
LDRASVPLMVSSAGGGLEGRCRGASSRSAASPGEIAMAEHRPAHARVEFSPKAPLIPNSGLADIRRAGDAPGVRDSWLAQVYKRLGELHARRGDRSKARNYYVRFVELWKDR